MGHGFLLGFFFKKKSNVSLKKTTHPFALRGRRRLRVVGVASKCGVGFWGERHKRGKLFLPKWELACPPTNELLTFISGYVIVFCSRDTLMDILWELSTGHVEASPH